MDSRISKRFALPLLKGIWIFSLILWAYIIVDFLVFPQYQYSPITICV